MAASCAELWKTMVSIRRRKLLGLCSGRDSFLAPHTQLLEQGQSSQDRVENIKLETTLETGAGSSFPSPPKEYINQQLPEIKRRKRHRRKLVENQEPCVMRGVYFKNMKWQAAIKVDKKQIHLGTVGSQEEAARLYDRAAFMCGRGPNFELSEEEKKELRKFKWDEFLAMTRSAINNKKSQRRTGPGNKTRLQDSNWEGEEGNNGFSASEEGGLAP